MVRNDNFHCDNMFISMNNVLEGENKGVVGVEGWERPAIQGKGERR